jgi:hypothetical protein
VSARDEIGRAFDFLRQRRLAYQLTFSTPKLVARIRTAYRAAFTHPAGEMVLADLAKFCRAAETCVIPGDHDRTLILEGRRECFLRITDHLNLSSEQLYALYAGRNAFTTRTQGESNE